ncbi:hypothetical protein HPB51_029301 [Rhipicephalus microplus]|uniref:DDE Tnp4 domain-containing protein n=1 Tax=Rhipicephalus microplus TaxID=6941 RepID=A0A9J6CUY4_RHIMP|nr:hypothetical protein HPB51_029301 [Rhipicephalus microplus]
MIAATLCVEASRKPVFRYRFPLLQANDRLRERRFLEGFGAGRLECAAPPTKRAVWMREQCQDWWDRIVATNFNDNDWRENFRMSRHNFCHLVAAVAPFMSPCENYVRTPVPLDKRVAIALYKLASCGEYRIVANQFGVHKSTVKKFFYMFCQSATTHLAKEYVKLPSANEAKKIAERFEAKCHLPQIFGAIDGTHIPITAPKTGYRDFVNRKFWVSYNVQAVVDDGGLVFDVITDVFPPGCSNSAFVSSDNRGFLMRKDSKHRLLNWSAIASNQSSNAHRSTRVSAVDPVTLPIRDAASHPIRVLLGEMAEFFIASYDIILVVSASAQLYVELVRHLNYPIRIG